MERNSAVPGGSIRVSQPPLESSQARKAGLPPSRERPKRLGSSTTRTLGSQKSRQICSRLGMGPAALIDRADSDVGKSDFDAETDVARALGIFGVPTFAVGSELFWGHDRMDDAFAWALAQRWRRPLAQAEGPLPPARTLTPTRTACVRITGSEPPTEDHDGAACCSHPRRRGWLRRAQPRGRHYHPACSHPTTTARNRRRLHRRSKRGCY